MEALNAVAFEDPNDIAQAVGCGHPDNSGAAVISDGVTNPFCV